MNDMLEQSLSGIWEFRFQKNSEWQQIPVPGCWDALSGAPKDFSGPVWYKKTILIPSFEPHQKVRLHFGAVSYDCSVHIDGKHVGTHRGLWDTFTLDITESVKPGMDAVLLVEVEKPAGRTAGYESESLPGNYPLRETLSGFIPYVWGHIFGGIWQDVRLTIDGPLLFEDVHIVATSDGKVTGTIETNAPAVLEIEIQDSYGTMVARLSGFTADSGQGIYGCRIQTLVADSVLWSPTSPVLYTAIIKIVGGESRRVEFGFRTLDVQKTTIRLNGLPVYPRMSLSWGWYPESLHSNPGVEIAEREFLRLKSLGFNGIKFCLWYPPDYYFQIADKLGMLVWLEFPLWLPIAGQLLSEQIFVEYRRLVRQVRNHPSVILYSLGCELNGELGQDLLEPLYLMVKEMIPQALVRDNSGSSEAYGGSLNESADYHDHHFYSDIHFFQALLDLFSPRWRHPKPWVFGEFCDLDTYRDLRKLGALDQWPWWTSTDPVVNPRGIRNPLDLPFHRERLLENGYWERGSELEKISIQQALLHRKWTIESVRAREEIGGYVITGQIDTPMTTAGILDDSGNPKFGDAEFSMFQSDVVLLVGWDRKRAWVAGGDRATFWDTWGYTSATVVRPHFMVSNYGSYRGSAELSWWVGFDDAPPIAQGSTHICLVPEGVPRELTVVEFIVPEISRPARATLHVRLDGNDLHAFNAWPIYCYPAGFGKITGLASLHDPAKRLMGLQEVITDLVCEQDNLTLDGNRVLISTAFDEKFDNFVRNGGHAILLLSEKNSGGPFKIVENPFWRESLKVIEPHPSWGDFPNEGFAGLSFYGCATSQSLIMPEKKVDPILMRLDARTMALHAYAFETSWGNGRMIVSTLRFEGGHGDQPSCVSLNTSASYLLENWVEYLANGNNPRQ